MIIETIDIMIKIENIKILEDPLNLLIDLTGNTFKNKRIKLNRDSPMPKILFAI
jgi:hypothetical protein